MDHEIRHTLDIKVIEVIVSKENCCCLIKADLLDE